MRVAFLRIFVQFSVLFALPFWGILASRRVSVTADEHASLKFSLLLFYCRECYRKRLEGPHQRVTDYGDSRGTPQCYKSHWSLHGERYRDRKMHLISSGLLNKQESTFYPGEGWISVMPCLSSGLAN